MQIAYLLSGRVMRVTEQNLSISIPSLGHGHQPWPTHLADELLHCGCHTGKVGDPGFSP